MGLKNNILNGINTTFENYEKAIFLEDDLEVSKSFLSYMNKSLEKYINDKNVKHISGYNYPGFGGNQNASYFTPYMSCWGWGTWKDRWSENKNFTENNISNKNKLTRLKFTVLGYEKDFESQLIRNSNNEINTWAIYWFQHIFLNKGLCLNPIQSLVINNGVDGVHGTNSKVYGSELNSLKVITLQKCKKIITDGKIIKRPADEDGRFYSLFYNNQEYFVEIIYNLNMKSYFWILLIKKAI